MLPVLEQYCRHVVEARRLNALIVQAVENDLALEDYAQLLKMRGNETRVMLSLATKMRITAQARISKRGNKVAPLDAPEFGGNGDGSIVGELVTTFVSQAAAIPFGTVTPEQAEDPSAITVTYRNFGRTTHWGIDAAFAYYASNGWRVEGNYSYVSDDLFENLDNIADIALNAPKNKPRTSSTRNTRNSSGHRRSGV